MGNSSRKCDAKVKINEITPESLMNSQFEAEVVTYSSLMFCTNSIVCYFSLFPATAIVNCSVEGM